MGLFSRLFSRRAAPPPPNSFGSFFNAFAPFSSRDIALNSTVQACGNVIANSVSIMPLNLYFRNPNDGSRQKAGWHSLYKIIKARPNLADTPVLFFGRIVRDVLQKGNAYIWKNYSEKTGELLSVHRLNPDSVTETYNGLIVSYTYGGITYSDAQILHITSLIVDDHGKGFSPLEFAKTAVRLGIQLDEYSLSSFGNGLNTKLIIDVSEATKDMNEEAAAKYARTVSDYVHANYTGAENSGKPYIQFMGKATPITGQSSNREAELLESRKWQELEICKIFGVPPFLVNGSYDIKYGNLEAAMTVFLNFSLTPYLKHIEARFNSLLSAYEQDAYYFEFDFSSLLRPDEKSRADFYTKLFAMGAISPGIICAKENIDAPAEGGDARFVPANMMPLRQDVLDAYMAGAKLKAAELGAGGGLSAPAAPNPSSATGSQAQ